jgi:hypothetical protein
MALTITAQLLLGSARVVSFPAHHTQQQPIATRRLQRGRPTCPRPAPLHYLAISA